VLVPAALATVASATAPTPAATTTFSSVPLPSWRLDGTGRAILQVGNTVYVGGSFSQVISPDGSQRLARRNLAAFDVRTGAPILSFRADADNAVYDLATDGASLFVGGAFVGVNGVSRARLAAVDPITGAVRAGFRADTNGNVHALDVGAGRLWVAGSFSTIGGAGRDRAAAVSLSTGAVDGSFRPRVDSTVHAIAVHPDSTRVYVGGPYNQVNGQPAADITTLDTATGATVGPALQGVVDHAYDLEVTTDGSRLVAAHAGTGNRSAVYDTTTGRRIWRQQVDGDTQAVDVVGDQVFAGFHDGADGDGATRAALYDLDDGTRDRSFRPSFDRFMGVWSVDGDGSALVVAGNFSIISGVRVEGFAIFPAGPPTPFATEVWGGEPWRYRDDGVDPGAGWTSLGYDDTTWSSGIGEFGYGDGDERTVVSSGPSSADKHITTWFRRTFEATGTPATAAIYMRVDDGAVVHVNGVEATRDNMPTGPVTSTTTAFVRDGFPETDVRYFPIDPSLIRAGTNVVAVEVHQSSASSNDLTFFATVVAYGVAEPPTTTAPASTTASSTSSTSSSTTSTTVAPRPTTVVDVPIGAVWSYLDDGSDQGTAWRAVDFDDSGWPTGIGEFGYGDGDERTVVDFGPSSNRTYPTTWFRHRFTATAVPDTLTLRLRVDDGAIVYLNGVEVARVNLPAGPVGHMTLASSAIHGSDERLDRTVTLDHRRIAVGDNVLAVEVHQHTRGSSDLSFLASLVGVSTSTAAPVVTTTTTSTSPTTTSTTSTTTTTSSTTTTSPTTTSPATTSTTSTTTLPRVSAGIEVPSDAVWSYLDDGSDQGTAWRAVDFDDSGWPTGIGEFGYGDGDERTVVAFGPDSSRKHPTTWFRHRFTAAGTPSDLTLTLRVDDGAIVHLNGVEVARFNLPTGEVDHLTRADVAIWGSTERLDRRFAIDPSLIRVGENVLAVQVHQDTLGSSDITFLASLSGTG
jgi:hypothetical protein